MTAIAVVGALARELEPFARRLAGRRPPRPGASWSSESAGRRISLMTTGDGAHSARRAAAALLAEARPRALLAIGCAGGATADLRSGDVIVARRVIDGSSGAELVAPDSRWHRHAAALEGVRSGSVVSVARIAVDGAAKSAAARRVSEGPVAVDLEGWSWAACAAQAGVPFVLLRGVLDPLDECLPLDFETLRDGGGRVDPWRVARAAALRPWLWPALADLRRRLRRVAERLGECGLEVVHA